MLVTVSTAATGGPKCGERHTLPCVETTVFLPLAPYPASPANHPGPSSPTQPLRPGSCTPASCPSQPQPGTGTEAQGDGAEETKLPSTRPLKIITAFSKADFARCQGKNYLSRHLSVLVKKQKACQGRARPRDREGFLRSAG